MQREVTRTGWRSKAMLRIAGETNLKPNEVIQQAARLFTQQCGLIIKEESLTSIELEGGGGGIVIGTKPGARKTEVEIVTNQWEEPVKDFLAYLSKK
jgi:hypothetical protein